MKKLATALLVLAIAVILAVMPMTAFAANDYSTTMEVGVEVTREEAEVLEKSVQKNAASFTFGLNSGKVSWVSPDGKTKDSAQLSADAVPSMNGVSCEKYVFTEDKGNNTSESHLVVYGNPTKAGTYTFDLVFNNYMNTEETGIEMGTTTSQYKVVVTVTGEDAPVQEAQDTASENANDKSTTDEPTTEPLNEGLPIWIWIVIAAVVVIAVVVVIIVVSKKKSK